MALRTQSTDEHPPSERFDFWREVVCDVFVPLDVEPRGARPDDFNGSVQVAALDGLQLVRVDAGAQHVRRAPTDDREDCLLSIQLDGRGIVRQETDAYLDPGMFSLYDATRPYELLFDDDFHQLVVQFPRQRLIERGIDPQRATARAIGGSGLAGLVASYLAELWRVGDAVDPCLHQQVAGQALDLLALALAPVSADGGALEQRMRERQRVLSHVTGRLGDPTLSVSDVARRLGVSTRYLQKLFADGGEPLGRRIRHLRLERARTLLVTRPERTIAAIASEVGFADAANFSRSFRDRFGMPPGELRRANATERA